MFSASKLVEIMRARKMTPADLARAAGLSGTYIRNLADGKVRLPKQPYLDALVRALGIAEAELFDIPGLVETDARRAILPADVEEVQVHLLALRELDPQAIKTVREVILAMKAKAEVDFLNEQRVKRAARKKRRESVQNDNPKEE